MSTRICVQHLSNGFKLRGSLVSTALCINILKRTLILTLNDWWTRFCCTTPRARHYGDMLFSHFPMEVLLQLFGQTLPPGETQGSLCYTFLFWSFERSNCHFPYLSCVSLYLFNLSASSLFSSIHRCKSSSFSLQACANSSFSPFCAERTAANSLDWHSAVNSYSERVAFRVLLSLARVRASRWYWDTLKQPRDEMADIVLHDCTFDHLVVLLLQTVRCWILNSSTKWLKRDLCFFITVF